MQLLLLLGYYSFDFLFIKINDPISLLEHTYISSQTKEVKYCSTLRRNLAITCGADDEKKLHSLAPCIGLLHYGVQSIICVQSHRAQFLMHSLTRWPKFSSPPPIKLACKLAAGAIRECTSAGSGHATMIECTKICTKRRGTHASLKRTSV